MLFREETRWPGYYYRGDFPKLDEENWKVLRQLPARPRRAASGSCAKVPFATKIP